MENNHKAQSLLELAVFGAMLITLLGVLITYGLKNKYQQQIMQQAFRKALGVTAEQYSNGQRKGQANYLYIRDRHTPNPENPFGLGSVSPYMQSAQVIRDYRMNEHAETEEELPRLIVNIPNSANGIVSDNRVEYKLAGFADKCVTKCPDGEASTGEVKKYEEIYGYNSVWEVKDGDDEPVSCTTSSAGEGLLYKAIDYCEGDIMSYDSCKLQCAKITDESVCIEECKLARLDSESSQGTCADICSYIIEIPWYCSEIESLFQVTAEDSEPKEMGLQDDYGQTSNRDNLLQKTETEAGINTTDTLNWSDLTRRTIVLIRNRARVAEPIESTVSHTDERVTWETEW